MRHVIWMILACCVLAVPLRAELAAFSLGFDSWQPRLEQLNASLAAAGSDRFDDDDVPRFHGYASVPLSWIIPPARWLWIDGGYSSFEAETAPDALEIELHRVELTGSLYMHLFRLSLQMGGGFTAVLADVDDPEAQPGAEEVDRALGGHLAAGVAYPVWKRLGVQLVGRWHFVDDLDLRNADVGLGGRSWRLGIAYLPQTEDGILNWAWCP